MVENTIVVWMFMLYSYKCMKPQVYLYCTNVDRLRVGLHLCHWCLWGLSYMEKCGTTGIVLLYVETCSGVQKAFTVLVYSLQCLSRSNLSRADWVSGSVRKPQTPFVSIDTNTNFCAHHLFHNLFVCVFKHKLDEFVPRVHAAYQRFFDTQTQTQTYVTIQNLIYI